MRDVREWRTREWDEGCEGWRVREWGEGMSGVKDVRGGE